MKRQQQPLQTRSAMDSKQLRRASSLVDQGFIPGRRSSSLAYSKQCKHETRPINDRAFQASCIRTLNAYFHSHAFSLSLSPKTLPSGKDVKDIITFLVRQLDPAWELGKLEDDVPMFFRHYGYPFQINKSALYAAGSPHSWPALLAGLSWLVQLLNYKERVESEDIDDPLGLLGESYHYYLRGDDDRAQEVDHEFVAQVEEERDIVAREAAALENVVGDLETKIKGLETGFSMIEDLNKKKGLLTEDVSKFHVIISNLSSKKEALEKGFAERKQEMEAKNLEIEKKSKENEELRHIVESQQVNIRDYEKMNREYASVETDLKFAEEARKQWEEKAWRLEVSASKKLKELEGAIDQYNQEIAKLKLGSAYEYKLNSRGVIPTEVLGVDFKAIIKPGIISSTEDYERNSREKWEESVTIQQKLHEKGLEQENKRNVNNGLSAKLKKLQARHNAIRKSMDEYISLKTTECERLSTEVDNNENAMKRKEAEAEEFLKEAKSELEVVIRRYNEEINACCNQLVQFIDAIAKHKEHIVSSISEVRESVSEAKKEVNSMYISCKKNATLAN